ncbi:hypothetical protein G9A89_011805 [Geosiphon pyriformis]|nr:hypothetical protein G9A89_011805 [Geosiphon pyriformis]
MLASRIIFSQYQSSNNLFIFYRRLYNFHLRRTSNCCGKQIVSYNAQKDNVDTNSPLFEKQSISLVFSPASELLLSGALFSKFTCTLPKVSCRDFSVQSRLNIVNSSEKIEPSNVNSKDTGSYTPLLDSTPHNDLIQTGSSQAINSSLDYDKKLNSDDFMVQQKFEESDQIDSILYASFCAYIQNQDIDGAKAFLKDGQINLSQGQLFNFFKILRARMNESEFKSAERVLYEHYFANTKFDDILMKHWENSDTNEIIRIFENYIFKKMKLDNRELEIILAAYIRNDDQYGCKLFLKDQNFNIVEEGSIVIRHMEPFLDSLEIEKAKKLLESLSAESMRTFEPNTPEFGFIINRMIQANNWQLAWKTYQDLMEQGIEISEQTYATFITGFLSLDRFDEVMTIWKHLIATGFKPSEVLYCSMIIGFARRRNTKMVEKLWENMLANKIKPNSYVYSAAIEAYFRARDPEKAGNLYLQMVKDKIPINVIACNRIINGLLWNRRIDTAMEFYEVMKKGTVKPNIITYNTLIRGLMYEKRWDLLIKILTEMKEAGHEMDTVSYTTMLERFFALNDMESAKGIMELFGPAGVKPTAVTYGALIGGLIRCKDFEGAEKAYNEMCSKNIFPGIQIMSNIIQGYVSRGRLDIAENLYQTLRCTPTTGLLDIMMGGYMTEKKPDMAMRYFGYMLKLQIRPTKDTYYVMLTGLMNAGRWSTAYQMYDDMMASGFKPESGSFARLCQVLLQKRSRESKED